MTRDPVKIRAANRRKYLKLTAGGTCKCGAIPERGKTCRACLDTVAARKAQFQTNGRCPTEGKPVTRFKYCTDCRVKAASRVRRNKARDHGQPNLPLSE